MIKLKQAVIVEGKYDKIRLSNIIDATIIQTDGFRIFKDSQKCELIRLLSKKCGIIVITDSDSAGQMIRSHIKNIAKDGQVTNIYLPTLKGKEKRKIKPSAEGLLGVEGTDDVIIIEALKNAGLTHTEEDSKSRSITKGDLYTLGLSGTPDSSARRKQLSEHLNIPCLPTNTLLDALNTLFTYDSFMEMIDKWSHEETEN